MRIRATVAATALLGLVATGADAQQRAGQNPVELGMDAQIAFGLDDQGTLISIPAQKIRAGFMLTPVMTIEPSLGFVRFSTDAAGVDISGTRTDVDVSLLYHFSALRTARQFYLRPVVGLMRESASVDGDGDADSNLNLGIAGGMKFPLMDRLGTRFEVEFRNYMNDPSESALNFNFGLSFFTR